MAEIQDDVTCIYDQQNEAHPILVVLSGPSGVGQRHDAVVDEAAAIALSFRRHRHHAAASAQ